MAWFAQSVSLLDGPEDFDVMIRRVANSMLPLGATVEEADGDVLRIGGITTTLTNLRRAWVEQVPEDRVPWLERTVSAFVSHQPIPDALDLSRVRPSVVSKSALGISALRTLS